VVKESDTTWFFLRTVDYRSNFSCQLYESTSFFTVLSSFSPDFNTTPNVFSPWFDVYVRKYTVVKSIKISCVYRGTIKSNHEVCEQ
jgi:hypothetical protein